MTWYITLRGASDHSVTTPTGALMDFLASLPELERAEQRGAVFFVSKTEQPRVQVVFAAGDVQGNYHIDGPHPDRINVIELICADSASAAYGDDLAMRIAKHLGWQAHEDQESRQIWPIHALCKKAHATGPMDKPTNNLQAVNQVDADGRSELHRAAYFEDFEWVKRCVEAGFDVNLKDRGGWTPVIWAIDMASTSDHGVAEGIIAYLLQHGARMDIQPFAGQSLVDFAKNVDADVGLFVEQLLNDAPND